MTPRRPQPESSQREKSVPIKPVHINRRTKKPTAAHWKWAIACCIGLLMTGPALSAGRIALLIGNQKYTHHKPLENPERDVELVADALKRLGFVPKVLKNAGRAAMVEAIDEFVAESSGKDVALFYYAGHGMQPLEGGRNFLLPVDARSVSKDSILSADGVVADATGGIVQKLERLPTPARMRLVLLDACRNNPRSGRNHRDSDRGMTPTMPEDLYTLVSYSTSEAAPAKDDVNGSKHSPYAQAVARLLPKASVRSVRDVFDEISLEVRRATGGDQEPGIYSKLPGNILLSGRNQELSPAQREADAWYEAQSINTPEALRTFLDAFPNGQYAAIATIRLKGLIRPADPPAAKPKQDLQVPERFGSAPTGPTWEDAKKRLLAQDGSRPTFQAINQESDTAGLAARLADLLTQDAPQRRAWNRLGAAVIRIGFEEDLSRRAPRESRIYGYWTLEVADRPQCQVNFPPGWLGRSGLGGLTLSRDEAVARGRELVLQHLERMLADADKVEWCPLPTGALRKIQARDALAPMPSARTPPSKRAEERAGQT